MKNLDQHKAHIDVSKWENVALLVLDRLQSYDEKFDKLIELQEEAVKQRQDTLLKISNIQTRVMIHDFMALGIVGFLIYILMRGF